MTGSEPRDRLAELLREGMYARNQWRVDLQTEGWAEVLADRLIVAGAALPPAEDAEHEALRDRMLAWAHAYLAAVATGSPESYQRECWEALVEARDALDAYLDAHPDLYAKYEALWVAIGGDDVTTAEATGYAFKGGNVARWQRHRLNPIQRTPDGLFDRLDAEFHFTLDAAASDRNAKCARYFTRDSDGLGQDWGVDVVWVNPPFGRGLREWARKAWEASRSGATVVLLVPSSTDMDWWHDYVLEADEIRFIRGRMSFGSEDLTRSNYVFPVSLAVFRPRFTGERVSLDLVS